MARPKNVKLTHHIEHRDHTSTRTLSVRRHDHTAPDGTEWDLLIKTVEGRRLERVVSAQRPDVTDTGDWNPPWAERFDGDDESVLATARRQFDSEYHLLLDDLERQPHKGEEDYARYYRFTAVTVWQTDEPDPDSPAYRTEYLQHAEEYTFTVKVYGGEDPARMRPELVGRAIVWGAATDSTAGAKVDSRSPLAPDVCVSRRSFGGILRSFVTEIECLGTEQPDDYAGIIRYEGDWFTPESLAWYREFRARPSAVEVIDRFQRWYFEAQKAHPSLLSNERGDTCVPHWLTNELLRAVPYTFGPSMGGTEHGIETVESLTRFMRDDEEGDEDDE